MLKLVKITIIALLFAAAISLRDNSRLSDQYRDRRKELFLTILLILVLGIFTGLRTWYNDTVTYLQMYERAPLLSEYWGSADAKFSSGIGFGFINSLLKTMGATSQDFIMVYGVTTMALYVIFLRRYADSLPFSIFLFFSMGCFVFAQAAIKQSIATAICCWSVHYAIERKWLRYLIMVLLASLFHPYALIYLLVPFMTYRPWTFMGYFTIIVSLLIGFSMERVTGIVLDITSMMGATYDENTFTGEGVNIFRVVVCLVPTIISFLFRDKIYWHSDRKWNLIMNLTMLNGLIMFIGIFGTANYYARLANYFLIMQTLALPWLMNKFCARDKRILTSLCVMCYCGYFYYESGIRHPFDNSFSQVSLWDYLKGKLS